MAILTTDFPRLTDDLQSIFNEAAQSSVGEMVGNKIFEVKDTNRRTHDHLILHGMDVIRKVAQGADLPSSTLVEGDNITFTQSRYGGIVSVTKDMRMFDLYDEIERVVRSAADDAFHKVDQSMADLLLNGFSASNYTDVYGESVAATGYDGLALFSTVHSNNVSSDTFSNFITNAGSTSAVVLSREAIVETRARAMKFRDPNGLIRPVMLDTVLVSPDKEDEALRIINSQQISGSGENDVNPLRGKMKVEVWPRLALRSDGTDTSAYWFMYDSKRVKETLKALFAERPSLDAPEQVYKNKNWDYSVDFYYTLGRGYSPFLYGTTAA